MGALHASAARRRITPSDTLRALWNKTAAKPFSTPNSDIYVQALVFSDMARQMLVHLGGDIIMTFDPAIRTRIAQEFKVKDSCIFFSCTHNHMVPSIASRDGPTSPFGGGEGMTQWSEMVIAAALDALREAVATLRPARMGAGHGVSGTSVNREWDTPVGSLGTGDRNGDTMHQQSVLRVDEAGGKPIAILVNGNCHAGSFFGGSVGLDHRITGGDVAGFVSTFIGNAIGDGVVPIWAIGGAGDQNTYFHSGMMWPWVDGKGQFVQETYVMKDPDAIALARNAATIQCMEVLDIYHRITEFSENFDLKTGIAYRKVPHVRDTRPPPGVPGSRPGGSSQGAAGGPPGPFAAPPPSAPGGPQMEEVTLRFYLIALNGIAFAGANSESFIALKRGALSVLPYDEKFWIDMNSDATGFAGYVPGPRYDTEYDDGRRHNLQGQIMPYSGNDALRLYCNGLNELVRTIA